jgi:hypothetical protein
MNTTLTFDEEFESLYERLCADEFTNKFIQLSGLSLEKMDIGSMSHKYFTENWADEKTPLTIMLMLIRLDQFIMVRR